MLLPGLYNTRWYNSQAFKYEEGFLSNKKVFLVGMPRLRQLRIHTGKGPRLNEVNMSVVNVRR